MVTDRGPNGQIPPPPPATGNRRTFPVPEFDPLILRVRAAGSVLELVQTIPILTPGGATNILSTQWDNPATSPTLEELADPAAAGVTSMSKALLANLEESNVPDKIEGIALGGSGSLAIANDNDFNITAAGTADSSPTRQRSLVMLVMPPQRAFLPQVGR